MPAGAAHQFRVESDRRPASPGVLVYTGIGANDVGVYTNRDPQSNELYTLVIDTQTDAELYGVNLLTPYMDSVAINSGAGATQASIAEDLAAAWNLAPLSRGTAVADGLTVSGSVTFTGGYPGVAFSMEEDENPTKMTLVNTNDAGLADAVPFGRAMITPGYLTDRPEREGILAKAGALAPRVSTLTVTYAAAERYTVGLTVEGVRYSVDVLAVTNDALTAAAIEAAIDLMMPAATVDATVATNVVTLTAEVAGKHFEVDLGLVSGTTSRLVLADTTNTANTDFNAVFAGVSLQSYDLQQQSLTVEAAEWPPNAGVEVLHKGAIWVESDELPTARGKVYVELAAGATAGRFYTAATATRVLVDPDILRWARHKPSTSDAAIASLSIDLRA